MVLLLLSFLACSCEETVVTRTRLEPGEQLPQFTVRLLDGGDVDTFDLLGNPSLVVFFSTTCPDCHRQLPEIQAAYVQLVGSVSFLAIARDEKEDLVRAFWNASGYSLPVSAPGDKTIYDIFDRGSQTGVPQVYISDPQGKVIRTADDKNLLSEEEIIRIFTENIK